MDPQWIPGLSHETAFNIQRQRLGLPELVESEPQRVAQLCGDLLLLTRLQEATLRDMAIRCADHDAAEHRRGLAAASWEPVAVPFATA